MDEERVSSQEQDVLTIPLSPVHPYIQPQEQEKVDIGEEGGEMVVKDSRIAWKNFNVRIVTMGIVREVMNPMILAKNQDQPKFEELINPAIVAITDNAREIGMNLLNNS